MLWPVWTACSKRPKAPPSKITPTMMMRADHNAVEERRLGRARRALHDALLFGLEGSR
jgi:hypothetical protein